jgi:hypothetical protein
LAPVEQVHLQILPQVLLELIHHVLELLLLVAEVVVLMEQTEHPVGQAEAGEIMILLDYQPAALALQGKDLRVATEFKARQEDAVAVAALQP